MITFVVMIFIKNEPKDPKGRWLKFRKLTPLMIGFVRLIFDFVKLL